VYREVRDLANKVVDLQNKIDAFDLVLISNLHVQRDKHLQEIDMYNSQYEELHATTMQAKTEWEKMPDADINVLNNYSKLLTMMDKWKFYDQQNSNFLYDLARMKGQKRTIEQSFDDYSVLQQLFSKELLLIVLQQSLPVLQNILNKYLAWCVDYSVKMELIIKDS
jgi:hypothetical protein